MNHEKISIIASSPIIKELTFSIIKSIQLKKFPIREERQIIHADLVPKFSEEILHSLMGEEYGDGDNFNVSSENQRKNQMEKILNRGVIDRNRVDITKIPISSPQMMSVISGYEKIIPLLNDSSVYAIECPGPGKNILVHRGGQKQLTKIVLSREDIMDILERVSDEAHIPLFEGVFKAILESFSINAIVSESVGSKFIIKKPFPYIRYP